MTVINLPFPPSALSGHATGEHWSKKSKLVKAWRSWAHVAALEAKAMVPAAGDIVLTVTFYPPDRRSDRANYGNRMKPIFDGIADALRVNDKRFVPVYRYAEPEKPGRVEITL